MFQCGYILSRNADLVWFLGLPFAALAAALACQEWLSPVALASVTLWITIPHHFATWVRAYGIAEDRRRWKARLIFGPIVIFTMAVLGLLWAPITTLLLAILWDKQHALMQQHGFARIYDFKAGAGDSASPRMDLWLNWALFANLFFTSPLFTPIWLVEMYRLRMPLSAGAVRGIHAASWSLTAVVLLAWLVHSAMVVRRGGRLNPIKVLFLGVSYSMWYFLAWHTSAVLVFSIAHALLHGIQYIVISYWYTRHRTARTDERPGWAARLVRPGNVALFLAVGAFYAILYQFLVGKPLTVFGFGFWNLRESFNTPLRELAHASGTGGAAYDLFAAAVVETASLAHFYLDSFIWKVSDARTREGL